MRYSCLHHTAGYSTIHVIKVLLPVLALPRACAPLTIAAVGFHIHRVRSAHFASCAMSQMFRYLTLPRVHVMLIYIQGLQNESDRQ